jgi:hypothetical protein
VERRRVTRLALRFGAIEAEGLGLLRSGLNWLVPDGHACRAGEIVAFCTLAFAGTAPLPFAEERSQIQIALAPRVAGRLRHAAGVSNGGILDRIAGIAWEPDQVWGHVERPSGEADAPDGEPLYLFMAGRRFTEIADARAGLLNGWHDRTRAWWGDGTHGTLIGAGICEQDAILRGADDNYRSLFAHAAGPAHVIHSQDEPLVPCAAVLAEQLARTDADRAAIREDIARNFGANGPVPSPQEWMFVAALLNALERSPLSETHDVLTRRGVHRTGPADAICLSLTGELPVAARHRTLGYTLNCHNFVLAAAGPAVKHWLRASFEPFARTPEDVARDYRRLAAAVSGRLLFVVNTMSSFAYESVRDYRALDDQTIASLSGVRAKDLNLLLHDLAGAHDIVVVDADAIAADMGMALHLPDGVHGTGAFYGAVRAELAHQLDAWGVPGFARRGG